MGERRVAIGGYNLSFWSNVEFFFRCLDIFSMRATPRLPAPSHGELLAFHWLNESVMRH